MQNDCLYQQQLLNAIPVSNYEPPSFLALFLNQFFASLGLGTYWHKTFYGLKTQLREFIQQEQKQPALNLLLQALKENHFWVNHPLKWWWLMRIAMNMMQDLHLPLAKPQERELCALIKLFSNAPQPWYGYDVAYSFAALSLWCFQNGKVQKAIEYIHVAIHADPQWGYPEYLLGWYGLQLEGIDPIPHFARAIQRDEHFLHQLQHDPLCQYFPKMVETVKRFLTRQTKLPQRNY